MKERPILFSAPMVRAILDGRKTQTRRVLKPQPTDEHDKQFSVGEYHPIVIARDGGMIPGDKVFGVSNYDGDYAVPLIAPSTRLWVRETWQTEDCYDATSPKDLPRSARINYLATGADIGTRPRPSIFMQRWASRITLEVIGVKVERLQEISEADAEAEGGRWFDRGPMHESGWRHDTGPVEKTARSSFARIWNTINGPGAWDANPWVAAYTFKVLDTKGAGQ